MKKYILYCWAALLLEIAACSTPEKTISSDTQKIDSLIKLMTLEEKVTMIHGSSSFTSGGVPRLGIPEWHMSDGPHGVRMEHGRDWVVDKGVDDSCTYLPVGVALASTWNPELGYEFGKVLGSEAKYRGKDVILGPGINIMRTPLNGRNFEYLSEDPYLISKMVVGYIKGVQDQEISACVKHYALNNQETDRTKVNVEVSERALREIYLPGFKAAITEGGSNTIMGAYNKFRGEYCTHNQYLVQDILKGEWNFQGVMLSDWGAVMNTMEALNKGTDLEMGTDLLMLPNPDFSKFFLADTVVALVKSGVVKESLIDEKVRRILGVMYKTKMFGERSPGAFNTREHQQTALKIAEEAIVLLKNENILPLKKSTLKTVAIIGANATRQHAVSGGSSQVNAKYEITPLQGIKNIIGESAAIQYAKGYEIKKDGKANKALIAEAVKAASNAETTILVCGSIRGYSGNYNDNAYDAEGQDKPDMFLPFGQDELITAVLKANPNTIIVLVGGGPVDMSAWINKSKAIVEMWYAGMEGGNALAKVLFGEVNPSGKLPVTFPKKLEDSPAHKLGDYPGANYEQVYREDIFVGYRYFDTYTVEPQFAFGHGLSYTTFEYKNLSAKTTDGVTKVTLSVTNTGKVAGAEVVQLYVKDDESTIKKAAKELKAFRKVLLAPGETKQVEMELKEDAFQHFDETTKKWTTEKGVFTILVGSSSRDIRQTTSVTW